MAAHFFLERHHNSNIMLASSHAVRQLRSQLSYLLRPRGAAASFSSTTQTNAEHPPYYSHQHHDLQQAMDKVRQYDPAGTMPGRLLYGDKLMQTSYYAVRSFWVETGLRHGTYSDRHYEKVDGKLYFF